MTRYLTISFSILILSACHPDKDKLVDIDEIKYESTDASELFFKNVRRSYYDLEERRDAGIELYTLSEYEDVQNPTLLPTIAYNWRNDFVSIMLAIEKPSEDDVPITLLFGEEGPDQDKMLFDNQNIRTQTSAAVNIYNQIISKKDIYLVVGSDKKPLFQNADEQDMFRITVFDYLRFVEIR